jgi:hypothetical protein
MVWPRLREKAMRKILIPALAGFLGFLASLSAMAADDVGLLRVLVVQPTDLSAYVREVGTLQGLLKKAGSPARLRVWEATYAGPDTGTVVVSIEVPNLAALAKITELESSNAEISAELKKVRGMRKAVSDSLYDLISH